MRKKKVFPLLLAIVLGVGAVGCGGGKKPPEPDPDLSLENDYVYMWHQNGLNAEQKLINFQTPSYAMQVSQDEGKIVGMGPYVPSLEDDYGESDFSKLPKVTTEYGLKINEEEFPYYGPVGGSRLIESGRNLQRMDFLKLRFTGASQCWGKMEIAATLEHVSFSFQLYSSEACEADLSFSLGFGDHYTSQSLTNDRGIIVKAPDGSGFVFLRPADDPGITMTFNAGKITFSKDGVSVPKELHTGFGIIAIPADKVSEETAQRYYALEQAVVSAQFIEPSAGEAAPVEFVSENGYFRVDTEKGYGAMNFASEADRKSTRLNSSHRSLSRMPSSA